MRTPIMIECVDGPRELVVIEGTNGRTVLLCADDTAWRFSEDDVLLPTARVNEVVRDWALLVVALVPAKDGKR